MSIVTLRSLFEKKGCQVVMIVVGVALGLGLILPSLMLGSFGGGPAQAPAVLKVGERPVTELQLAQLEQESLQSGIPTPTDPNAWLSSFGTRVEQVISRTALEIIAEQEGVEVTEEQAVAAAMSQFETQLMMARFQLQQSAGLKPDADDKAFEEAFQKQYGRSVGEFRTDFETRIRAGMEEPETKRQLLQAALPTAVQTALGAKLTVTEAEVKQSYQTLVLNRIALTDPAMTPEQK
ncbi:MAG: hypothetical protein MH204_12005, partial [Fimbriimonadaceae bacterium]|nr:hypothetical protein [Fimbriimonadaceae bacterium]